MSFCHLHDFAYKLIGNVVKIRHTFAQRARSILQVARSRWSPWTGCTVTCGGGTMTRQRCLARKVIRPGFLVDPQLDPGTVLEPSRDGGAACTGESFRKRLVAKCSA